MDPNTEQLTEQDEDAIFEAEYAKATGGTTEPAPREKPEQPPVETEPETEPAKPAAPVEGKETTEEAKPDPNSWINELPEEARIRFLKEQQDFKANALRNAALQRHLTEARQQLESLKKAKDEPKPEPPKLDKWEALTETDNELAISVEQRIADAVAKASQELERKFQQRVAPIEEQNYNSYVQNELYMLKQAVPNYEEVVQDPHFHNWLASQSMTTQQKYNESLDHRDALDILKLYSFNFGYQPATQATNLPVPNPVADKVAAARDVRRQASTPVRSNAAGIPRNPSNEDLSDKEGDEVFDAAFAKFKLRG